MPRFASFFVDGSETLGDFVREEYGSGRSVGFERTLIRAGYEDFYQRTSDEDR